MFMLMEKISKIFIIILLKISTVSLASGGNTA